MGFLNTKVFIVEKFSFSSKSFFEFLKKKICKPLKTWFWILSSGNSSFKTLYWILEIVEDQDSSLESRLSTYLWPVLYVELLIPKYWRCSCCLYAVISLNFMWNKWIFAFQEWSFITQRCRIIVLRYKKIVQNCKFCHLNVQSQEATCYLEELPSPACRGN